MSLVYWGDPENDVGVLLQRYEDGFVSLFLDTYRFGVEDQSSVVEVSGDEMTIGSVEDLENELFACRGHLHHLQLTRPVPRKETTTGGEIMLFHTVLEVVGELVYLDGEELVQGVIDVVVQDLFNSIDAFPNGFPQGEVGGSCRTRYSHPLV